MNARYGHTAFGLRYLQANLGSLSERSKIIEFDLQKTPEEAAARIAEEAPSIVGIGAHIWNASRLPAWIQGLRTRLPSVRIVLGGPEVGFDDHADWAGLCDYMIAGEADQAFAELCRQLLNGAPPPGPLIKAPPPDLAELARPYSLYSDEDLAHRTLYVETSRGCPFTCEYCLSSVERSVRFFPLPGLFDDFWRLMDRGARHFKFVDRTFNLNIPHCLETLQFFLLEFRPGLFLHIEAIPDRLPQELRDILLRFPPASLQVEAGIQTWNPEIAARIQRKQDPPLLESNLRFLRESTSAYIHADLIAGLPGESLESFASGFDRLAALRPHEIQVGILKKLRGTAIGRHDAEWGMIYQTAPPYALKCNKQLSAEDMAAIHRFAHFWDSLYNSGHFIGTHLQHVAHQQIAF